MICVALWILTFAAAPAKAAEPAVKTTNSVAAIIQRHLAAAGGKVALANIESQLSTLSVQEGGQSFTAEIHFEAGDKLLLKVVTADGLEIRQGHDGRGHYWRQDPRGIRQFTEAKDLLDFRELSLCLSATALLELKQHFPNVEPGAEEKVAALDGQMIDAQMAQGSVKLWFDRKTGLLSKVGDSVLDQYRAEGGILVPHLIRKGNGDVLEVKTVTFNAAMADAQFAQPPGATVPNESGAADIGYATLLNPGATLGITRRPAPAHFGRGARSSVPVYQPHSQKPFQVDLRGVDVSAAILNGRLSDLLHADFDSKTVWPTELPKGFSPAKIMEAGKNPGLGVKQLHQKGVSGKGVGLAIIDQTLLVGHVEYRDQLRSYEELHAPARAQAQMHGPAVASIAVGKNVGVAPGADLYYVAETHGTFSQGKLDWDFTWLARSIDRILALNAALPNERKIRVISISVGWSSGQKGCAETDAAVQRAKDAGVFVISTAIERTHHLAFHGLGRDPRQDPEQPTSYDLGSWWADSFLQGQRRFAPGERLLVPMDARATASPTGDHDYVFYASGGWSWSVPYLAGLYALACQVQPDITPELFWATALKTGRTIPRERDGASYQLGSIVDPVALIEALQKPSS